MINSKGSTLAVALSVVFLFGAMGIGAIEYSSGQEQFAAAQTANLKSFWVADAGVQKAESQLPSTTTITGGNVGIGTYSASITTPYNGNSSQYKIISTGNNNGSINFQRTILAVYQVPSGSSFTFTNRMEIGGTDGGFGAASNSLLQTDPGQLFTDIFGISMSTFESQFATSLTSNTIGTLPAGLYFSTPPSGTLDATSMNIPGPSVLIVNGNINIGASANFTGIIWVTGNFSRTGNGSQIQGGVVVQGNATGNGGGTQNNGHFALDPGDTSSAVTAVDKPYVILWQECKNITCT